MKLYSYFRSSCSYRVRIALNLKNLACDFEYINLLKGEQLGDDYKALNPQSLLPLLVDEGFKISQSMAIIEYLDEKYPENKLLPQKPQERALVRSMSQIIACDIQPIQNLKVLKYLKGPLAQSDEVKVSWIQNFIHDGFAAFESYLQKYSGKYSFGDRVSLADICLMPQIYNARRFNCQMQNFPAIEKVENNLNQIPAFQKAQPSEQKDNPN